MLGPVDELCVLELVGAGGFDLFAHLFQPLHMSFGAESEGREKRHGSITLSTKSEVGGRSELLQEARSHRVWIDIWTQQFQHKAETGKLKCLQRPGSVQRTELAGWGLRQTGEPTPGPKGRPQLCSSLL